ncbi:EamA family transporter RarD [Pseudactinotalea sp. Z1739]|uniref:EamA family transporter RarD n=1 Tax=Pseudactinotalea sp. Z1739 TaxID=3413028 RepID=UPI003C7D1DB1
MPLTPRPQAEPTSRSGLIAGVSAYALWGLLPLYFPLMDGAGVWEIGAHRVLWSLVLCAGLLMLVRKLGQVRTLLADRRVLVGLSVAAVLLATNWVTFLYAVFTDRVVDAALGYFVNPLVTILLGVVVLRERLRPGQWAAVGVAAIGVVVIAIGYGTVPWIAVVLASSFGLYGLAKNRLGRTVPALPGLVVETAALTPVALLYLLLLAGLGTGTFAVSSAGTALGQPWHSLVLMGAGIATAVPLMLFATAVGRLPLSTVGLLQFIAPIMQFALGVLVLGEEMPPARLAGFVLVWVGLVLLGVEGQQARSRRRRSLTRS